MRDRPNGEVIAKSVNEVDKRHDPTAHAEIVAIRQAAARLQCQEIRGATLYTTCSRAGCAHGVDLGEARQDRFGAGRDDVHPMYFEDRSTWTRWIQSAMRSATT